MTLVPAFMKGANVVSLLPTTYRFWIPRVRGPAALRGARAERGGGTAWHWADPEMAEALGRTKDDVEVGLNRSFGITPLAVSD